MTMANVHEAMNTSGLIRNCNFGGRDSTEHCETWHRNLSSLKNELFQSLDAIGWHEFSDASNRMRELKYPPEHKGTSGLKRDLDAICDQLERLVGAHGRDPADWKPIGMIELLATTRGSADFAKSEVREQRQSYEALENENAMLRKKLEDRYWLQKISHVGQRGTMMKIIGAIAREKFDYHPDRRNSSIPSLFATFTHTCGVAVTARTIRGYLKKSDELFLERDGKQ